MRKIFMLLLIIGLIVGLFISCIPTTPSEGEGEPAIEYVESITDQEGIGTFTINDGQLSIEVLDANTEETIEDIECFLSTDGTDAVILLVDPDGEYVPRLISCQNEYSNKGLVWAGLKRIYLKLKIKFIEGGSHLVYLDEYLPEGLTKEILYQQYEHIDTTELKNLRRDLRGLINSLIDLGIGYIETTITTYVLTSTVIGSGVGVYYNLASSCYALNEILELGVINDFADEYENAGYKPDQKFEIWVAKWLSADFGSVLVLPCAPPKSSIPPTAYIDSIVPNPAQQGETVTFNGHGTDPDGEIMFYIWESNIDGLLSNLESFNRSDLSVGTHTISFKVFDTGANPSEVVSELLTITVEENGTYALCDIGPAGGYIFYDKGSYSDGWRYLEAAPVSTEWAEKQWGSFGTLIGGTGKGIGTGQSNTTIIVTWLNSHGETDCAAQLCDALVYGGYSDWFLPSKDELNLVFTNLKVYGVGGFDDDYYWSSSESSAYDAWGPSPSTVAISTAPLKDNHLRVRAVRVF